MPVVDRLPSFLQFCETQKRLDPKTVKAYRIDIVQFTAFLGECQNNAVSKETVRSYLAYLNQHFKLRSVKRKIASVKAFVSYLIEEGFLSENPFSTLHISYPNSLTLPRTIPLNIIRAMLVEAYHQVNIAKTTAQKINATRNVALIELLFATGMRISEVCRLQETELDLSEGIVFIRGKGNRERIVELANKEVLNILAQYNQTKNSHSEYFFLNNRGKPLSDQSARRIVENLANAVDPSRHITPHMFRHSFATLLLEEDVDIRYIQALLGHSSISTTQIYAYVSSQKRRAILADRHPRNKLFVK